MAEMTRQNELPEGFTEIKDEALDWNDTIENDSEFILLPAGDYSFEIVDFERSRHSGSDKLPPCNKAIVHIKVSDGKNSTTIQHNLFLHKKTEGILCAFFTAIGQRKHKERLQMNWNAIIGCKGRLQLVVDEFKGRDGDMVQTNKIKKFYEPENQQKFEIGKF